MGVRIGLARQGRKKQAHYRVRVIDTRRNARSGKYIEDLGYHDPSQPLETGTAIKQERLDHWLKEGAHLSDKMRFIVKELQKPAEERAKARAKAEEKKAAKAKAKEAEEAAAKTAEEAKEEASATEENKAEEKADDASAKEDKADA